MLNDQPVVGVSGTTRFFRSGSETNFNNFLAPIFKWLPYVTAFAVIGFLYGQMNIGHIFNEDYAVYLQESFNISHRLPLSEIGILPWPDPSLPLIYQSPTTYPPLLPLIYAGPVRVFGYNLELFKVLQLGLLLSGLLLFCSLMRRWRFTSLEILTSLLVFGFSYEVRRSINSIGPDLPFVLLFMLALGAIERFSQCRRSKEILTWGIAGGAALFLAVDMRTVAIALCPTFISFDLARNRTIRAVLIVPFATLAILWLVQRGVVGAEEAYGYIFQYRSFTVMENVKQFYWAMTIPIQKEAIGSLAPYVLLILSACALVGIVEQLMFGNVMSHFVLFYLGLLLVLPDFDAGARYLVPALLPFGAFACRGANRLVRQFTGQAMIAKMARLLVAAVGVGLFIMTPRPLLAGPLIYGVEAPSAQQVFGFIRQNVPSNALLAASKFRSFHLFTGLMTIRTPYSRGDHNFAEWQRHYGVEYIVIKTSPPRGNFDFSDCPTSPLCSIRTSSRQGADLVFQNQDYAVFRFQPMRSKLK